MKKFFQIFVLTLLLTAPISAKAGICDTLGDWYCTIRYNVIETWNEHSYDAYVPLYAWHNRLTYDKKHIDKYIS